MGGEWGRTRSAHGYSRGSCDERWLACGLASFGASVFSPVGVVAATFTGHQLSFSAMTLGQETLQDAFHTSQGASFTFNFEVCCCVIFWQRMRNIFLREFKQEGLGQLSTWTYSPLTTRLFSFFFPFESSGFALSSSPLSVFSFSWLIYVEFSRRVFWTASHTMDA